MIFIYLKGQNRLSIMGNPLPYGAWRTEKVLVPSPLFHRSSQISPSSINNKTLVVQEKRSKDYYSLLALEIATLLNITSRNAGKF